MTRTRSSRNARSSTNRARQAANRRASAAGRAVDPTRDGDVEDDLLESDAEKTGKGTSTADLVDEVDDDELDEDDQLDEDDEQLPRSRRTGRRTAAASGSASMGTLIKPARTGGSSAPRTRSDDKSLRPGSRSTKRDSDGGFFPFRFVAYLLRYLREIVSEMRKVIWPTRQEMTTYTFVVIVFVVVLVAFVAGLDVGFAKVVLWMFG